MWPRRPADGVQDPLRRGRDPLERAEQQRRIEIPLHAAVRADDLPPALDRDAPVEADDVAAGLRHRRQQCVVPVPKWIVGTSTAPSTRAE